jgi:hypothetical protein
MDYSPALQPDPLLRDLSDAREDQVSFAGDWHGNGTWAGTMLHQLNCQFPEVRTVLQAGDFGIMPGRHPHSYLEAVDEACEQNGIERILVTPGNHEDWDALNSRFATHPGEAIHWAERIWVLPRGYRFTLGGRTFLSFGGAASVDFAYRVPGESWWAAEMPTEDDVADTISDGHVDVLITHDTVDGGTPRVEHALGTNFGGWPVEALAYSAASRSRVTAVWKGVGPQVLVHGHMHIHDEVELADGRRIFSLGCDEQAGNVGVLTLSSLNWMWLAENDAAEMTADSAG